MRWGEDEEMRLWREKDVPDDTSHTEDETDRQPDSSYTQAFL